MQIIRHQTVATRHGHLRCPQGRDERPGHVPLRDPRRRQDHDDRAGGAPDARLKGFTGGQRPGRADELSHRPVDGDPARCDHDHLRLARLVSGKRGEHGAGRFAPRSRQHDDAGGRRGRLVEPRGHRVRGTVVALTLDGQVGCHGAVQGPGRSVIHDLPARRLDARLELIGPGPVPLAARARALLGERGDVGGR
jgi:hypothetical protein